jgi:hypothetical protein
MFRVHYSSLDRLRITFSVIMLTLSIGVSFSPRQAQGGFPSQTLPLSTLKALGVGDDLPLLCHGVYMC